MTTTGLRPGYVRKNGIPYGANAVITENFMRLADKGDEYLVVTTTVDDPIYFNPPYIKTYEFKRGARRVGVEPDALLSEVAATADAHRARAARCPRRRCGGNLNGLVSPSFEKVAYFTTAFDGSVVDTIEAECHLAVRDCASTVALRSGRPSPRQAMRHPLCNTG